MENPAYWTERERAIAKIFEDFENEGRAGIIGHSIYVKLAEFVDEELRAAEAERDAAAKELAEQNAFYRGQSTLVGRISDELEALQAERDELRKMGDVLLREGSLACQGMVAYWKGRFEVIQAQNQQLREALEEIRITFENSKHMRKIATAALKDHL